MEKLSMCRICLVDNVRMLAVSNKNLQDIYEKLTDIPLVTEDSRPTLACYVCYAKLKQCCRFKRKCLEAEELFAQMLNSCEQKPFKSHGNSGQVGGLEKTPVETISILDDRLLKDSAIDVEVVDMPAISQTHYEFIEMKVEHQSDEDSVNSHRDTDHVLSRHSTDSEDDMPLLRIKNEVIDLEAEEPQVSQNIRRAGDTQDRTPVMKKHELEDTLTAGQKKTEIQGSNIFQTSNHTIKPVYKLAELITKFKPGTNFGFSKNTPTCNNSNKDELKCKISKNIATDSDDDERPFKCDTCHRSFINKTHLKDHKRKHTGERPFECEICHRCFAISCHLKSHIRTHTDAAKPFKCDICQRSFTLKSNLRTHSLIHTGEKPYKCHICQRAFTQKIRLRSHILIHTGDRPFTCDICDRSFSVKHSLVRHIQVHDVKKYVTGKSDRVTRSTKSDQS